MKEYNVSGMSCAACVSRVEKAVRSVSGVTDCAVSLLTGSMTVEGDFSEGALAAALHDAGYGLLPKGAASETKEEEKESGRGLIVSFVFLFLLMYVSMGHMVRLPLPSFFTPMVQGIWQAILSLAILVIHRRFFIRGLRGALHGSPNMDTLVAMGSGVSYFYSLVTLFRMISSPALLHSLYFESAAMILCLVSVGKLLEEKSKGKTTSALKALKKLTPDTATVLREGKELLLPTAEVQVGDVVRILSGSAFPVDGVILEGEGAVDESALTGESVPVDKTAGDKVYSGTLNRSGTFLVRAEQVGGETILSAVIDRVLSASASKAPIARLADRVSGVFVPTVLGISLLTLLIHLFVGTPFGAALEYAIAVTVVSCPCALGLATPVAIMVAGGVAAREGILFKTASSLELAGKTKIVVLDKTGTVTSGMMHVSDLLAAEGVEEETLLSMAASLEAESQHPIAKAVVREAEERGYERHGVTNFQTLAGFGVSGVIDGKKVVCGKRDDVPEEAKRLASEGKTLMFLTLDGAYLGAIAVSDTLKEDSAAAISQMKKMGLTVVMITGDREETARFIAQKAGIDQVLAGVLPEGKADAVRAWKKQGRVMMVGDGINDAPALAEADLGVAIGAGVEIALDAAEVVLMKSTLADLPRLVALSRATLRNVKENLFWAFCYNLIGIPLAAGAFVPLLGLRLTPMFGAAAMSFSSIFVVSNALRLTTFFKDKKETKEKKKMEITLKIEGMMCPHCEAHVKKALEALDGVAQVTASHEKKEAKIRLEHAVDEGLLRETVEKEGYKVL